MRPHRHPVLLDDPAFFFENPVIFLIIGSDEALELLTRHEATRLGCPLDVFLPFRGLAHFLEYVAVIGDCLTRNSRREPDGARHLKSVERDTGLLAGRYVGPTHGARHLAARLEVGGAEFTERPDVSALPLANILVRVIDVRVDV